MEFNTLDEMEVENKTVLVRVDINSPLDPDTGEIMDDNRIRKCSDTLTELSEKGAKVVVIAHQGRPASDDFTTLERHAEKMSQVLGINVDYIDDLFGPSARKKIKNLESGDILLIENARFYSEEVINRPAEEQAETHFVKKLSPVADIYVNDAFAAAHRSQPSLVGFGVTLPAAAGRLMEKELKGLGKARNPEHPCVYLLGGAKVEDSITLIDHVLDRDIADTVLLGGLIGQLFLAADGNDLGESNMELLSDKGFDEKTDEAKKILDKYGERIKFQADVRVEETEGEATNVLVKDLPTDYTIYDIGEKTAEKYSEIIKDAKTVVANGPVGVFEKTAFAKGTNKLLEAMSKTDAYTTIGGGHMVASARELEVTDKIDHVSTGGGSCLNFLSGEKLPVVETLKESAK